MDRAEIKSSVRAFLKGRWGKPFLAWFLVYLLLQNTAWVFVILQNTVAIPSILPMLLLMPFEVTLCGYFLRFARGEEPPIGTAFDFKKHYGTYLGTVAWQTLWLALWSLLFLIPGIVKSYAYRFTSYIIYDNPKIGAQRALKLSMALTNGHKGELFVLDLSFILWWLLELVSFGLARIYVEPYYQTTLATYYEKLKQLAILQGKVDPAEFIAAIYK